MRSSGDRQVSRTIFLTMAFDLSLLGLWMGKGIQYSFQSYKYICFYLIFSKIQGPRGQGFKRRNEIAFIITRTLRPSILESSYNSLSIADYCLFTPVILSILNPFVLKGFHMDDDILDSREFIL